MNFQSVRIHGLPTMKAPKVNDRMSDQGKDLTGASEEDSPLSTFLREEGSDFNAFPVSYAQQRLWFIDQLGLDSPAYNVAAALRLSGSLDVAALRGSINEVVRRHESLRTSFLSVGGQPAQVIAPDLVIALEAEEVEGESQSERESEAEAEAEREGRRGFDLSRLPLLRVRLMRVGEGEHVLVMVTHHIVSDGWSMGVMVREIGALYEAYSKGEESPLEELAIQYADYAAWQREWLKGEELDRQMRYWKGQMEGAPAAMELPTDRVRPAAQTYRGAQATFAINKEVSERLRQVSRREGVTMFMLLLSGYKVLLMRQSGQEDVVVGTPIANRRRKEVEGLIGYLANTLVLRSKVRGEDGFRELLSEVKEVTLGGDEHQDVPFEKLVEELQPDRSLSYNPLFQVMFAFQNNPVSLIRMPGLSVEISNITTGTSKVDLTLDLSDEPGGIKGHIEYATDLYDEATIERMKQHYLNVVQSVASDPRQPIAAIKLLAEQERQQLLFEWNDTRARYERGLRVHELFERPARLLPERGAVSHGRGSVTYAELNRRADGVAARLVKEGVRSEQVVGVCVSRSEQMVVAMLG